MTLYRRKQMAVKQAVKGAAKEVAAEVKEFGLDVNSKFDKEVDSLAGDLQKSKVSGWILAGCGVGCMVVGAVLATLLG